MFVLFQLVCLHLFFRRTNNNIIVDAPDGDPRSVPNPVKTFEDAFQHYRKLFLETQLSYFHMG